LSLVTLRPATLADARLLRRWDEQPHVVASDPNDDWQWETALAQTPVWRESFIAEVDARPIGFLEIIDPSREDTRYWGDVAPGHRAIDIWIGEPDALGRGYGTQMMRLAIAHCFADPAVHTIPIDPLRDNTRARRFYERLGFHFVAYRRFGLDDCAVYHLRRPL
jgi:Acetyltransferases, including N-acetylases of ribosomal proteins